MKGRAARLLGAVGLAVTLAWCFFAFDETASRSSMLEDSPLEAEVVSTVREPEPLAFGPHAPDVAAGLVDPGVPRAAGATLASRETATRDDDGVTLRGTVVVDDGEERIEGLDGTLTIGIEPPSREWAAPRQDVRTRTVEAGRFRVRVPRDSRVRVLSARLSGRSVAMDASTVRAERDLDVVFRGSVEDLLLHVVDAQSGHDLPDVTIVRSPTNDAARELPWLVRPPIGEAMLAVRDRVASPVLLEPAELHDAWSSVRWFVRAEGYGWMPYVAPDARRWAHRLELRRAATLVVHVTDRPRDLRTFLRVRPVAVEAGAPEHRSPVLLEHELSEAGEPIVIDRLSPLRLSVAVEAGPAASAHRLVLARGDVELVSDRTVSLPLACALPSVPPRVPLAGTLLVPPGWEDDPLALRFARLDPPFDNEWTSVEIGREGLIAGPVPGRFAWDAGQVLPGSFVADVRFGSGAAGWSRPLDVGPFGDRDVVLSVPAPAELVVRLEGTVGGYWFLQHHCGLGPPTTYGSNAAGGREITLRVPVGPVALSAHVGGAASARRVLHVLPGTNEVTLTPPGRTGVRVLGEHEEHAWPSRAHFALGLPPDGVRVTRLDGGGSPTGFDDGPGVTFLFERAGRFRVTLDPPDGAAPSPPIDVDVAEGEIVDVRVPPSPSRDGPTTRRP